MFHEDGLFQQQYRQGSIRLRLNFTKGLAQTQTHHLLFPSESSYPIQTSGTVPPQHGKVLLLATGAVRASENAAFRNVQSVPTGSGRTFRFPSLLPCVTQTSLRGEMSQRSHTPPPPHSDRKDTRSLLKTHADRPHFWWNSGSDDMQFMHVVTNHVMCCFQMPTTLWIPINSLFLKTLTRSQLRRGPTKDGVTHSVYERTAQRNDKATLTPVILIIVLIKIQSKLSRQNQKGLFSQCKLFIFVKTHVNIFTSFSKVRGHASIPTDISDLSPATREGKTSRAGCTQGFPHPTTHTTCLSGLRKEASNVASLLHIRSALPPSLHAAAWIRMYSGIRLVLRLSDNVLHYSSSTCTIKINNNMFLKHWDEFLVAKTTGALTISNTFFF